MRTQEHRQSGFKSCLCHLQTGKPREGTLVSQCLNFCFCEMVIMGGSSFLLTSLSYVHHWVQHLVGMKCSAVPAIATLAGLRWRETFMLIKKKKGEIMVFVQNAPVAACLILKTHHGAQRARTLEPACLGVNAGSFPHWPWGLEHPYLILLDLSFITRKIWVT